jgi:hypothetical protein
VYGLIDPRNGMLRYVGLSTRGLKRPKSHWKPSCLKRDTTHKGNWIRQLLAAGLVPEIEILEELGDVPVREVLDEAERHWIGYFKMIGCNLTNMALGGLGALGVKMSDATKRAMSLLHKGKTVSAETRKLLSDFNMGKRYDLEYKAKMSKRTGGKGIIVDSFGNEFVSQHEAAKFHGVANGNVSKVLRGRGKTLRGVTFKYRP